MTLSNPTTGFARLPQLAFYILDDTHQQQNFACHEWFASTLPLAENASTATVMVFADGPVERICNPCGKLACAKSETSQSRRPSTAKTDDTSVDRSWQLVGLQYSTLTPSDATCRHLYRGR
jgi:hypothetical protein